MFGQVLVWCLSWYYAFVEAMVLTFTVLRIKFKRTATKLSNESKGHLALRLNDGCVLKTANLLELIEYCRSVFGVKYLTLIAGARGFEREIDIRGKKLNGAIYNNYELAYSSPADPQVPAAVQVNLVDNDSEALFLLKVKETLLRNDHQESADSVLSQSLKSFTNFPPIDLLFCMTHDLDLKLQFPLHLSFTQFYCCPVLADQLYSKEAITDGFERFSKTKQNFGK